MHSVAAISSATGTPYGAIVAAVAEAVATGAQFIPSTEGHDFVGFVTVKVTNQCGYIQTAWTTFSSANTAAGKVSNKFVDVSTLESIESRLAVLDSSCNTFWPNGVDWEPYAHICDHDQFWWITKGTSHSNYTFLLKAKVILPDK